MRYESLPRKVVNWLSSIFKYMKGEFGNWSYVLIAGMIALIYKPVVYALDKTSMYITYAFGVFIVLAILYWLFRKIVR